MISRSPHKKLAAPSALALIAAFAVALGSAPASAALAPGLIAPVPAASSEAAPQNAVQMAAKSKKKKKKKKKRRRGSFSS